MKVLVLAQNPKTEHNVLHPLDGTRSGRTVKAWLKAIGNPDVLVMNASRKVGKVTRADYDVAGVSLAVGECDRYLALGAYASGLLEQMGVPHATLPHPSGLNRKLNDAQDLALQLRLVRMYLSR